MSQTHVNHVDPMEHVVVVYVRPRSAHYTEEKPLGISSCGRFSYPVLKLDHAEAWSLSLYEQLKEHYDHVNSLLANPYRYRVYRERASMLGYGFGRTKPLRHTI